MLMLRQAELLWRAKCVINYYLAVLCGYLSMIYFLILNNLQLVISNSHEEKVWKLIKITI